MIHANGVLEFHRIEFKKGFKCSEHEHKFKWNGFYVESGKMIVRVWQDDQDGLVDETILNAGDFTQVKPGKVHQFEGLEDGVAFELYWAEFNHNDIVRKDHGSNKLLTDSSGAQLDSTYFPYNDLIDYDGDSTTSYSCRK